MSAADVIIVGGGPAAVSAAWPLVQAGLRVLMLDQGARAPTQPPRQATFLERRLSDSQSWREFLGTDFVGLGGQDRETPKMKVPAHQYVLDGFAEAYGLAAEGVHPVGSLARGGLSLMWGAGAYPFTPAEMTDWPVAAAEMATSYHRVASRIGISGTEDLTPALGFDHPLQPPVPLHPTAARLLQRYRAKAPSTFILGHARNAVVTVDNGDRRACASTGMCLFGCDRGSIYRADAEILDLERHANFRYEPNAFVEAVAGTGEGWTAHCRDLSGMHPSRRFTAPRLVLAAGTIGSTALALAAMGMTGRPVPFACHPAFAFAVCLPARLGAAWQRQTFALGQLAYQVGPSERPDAFGVVFSCEGLLATDVVQAFPFTAPRAALFGRALLPAVLVANGYLPSSYSDCRLTLEGNGERPVLRMTGGFAPGYADALARIRSQVAGAFRRLGTLPLPGSFRPARLGSDSHYAGTLPMTAHAPIDGRPTCRPDGEVRGQPGLYVADGAALPDIPAKHPTLTIMANADRIGRAIAPRPGGDS